MFKIDTGTVRWWVAAKDEIHALDVVLEHEEDEFVREDLVDATINGLGMDELVSLLDDEEGWIRVTVKEWLDDVDEPSVLACSEY